MVVSVSGVAVVLVSEAQQLQSINLPKIQQLDFVAKPFLKKSVAIDGNQAGMGCNTALDISFPQHYWSDRRDSSAGWVPVSGPIGCGFVDLPKFSRCWDDLQYQVMDNSFAID